MLQGLRDRLQKAGAVVAVGVTVFVLMIGFPATALIVLLTKDNDDKPMTKW